MNSDRCFVVFAVVTAVVGAACDPAPPTSDVLTVAATLPGPGGAAPIAFDDVRSRGEWWPCDARLTAQACVDDEFHVGVFIGRPEREDVSELGRADCVVDGAAQGAYEILTNKFDDFGTAVVGDDVSVFVLVASDKDGDGSADVEDADETRAVARLDEGTVEMSALAGFDDPLALRIEGKADGEDVVVEFRGPMSNTPLVPALESNVTCVAGG